MSQRPSSWSADAIAKRACFVPIPEARAVSDRELALALTDECREPRRARDPIAHDKVARGLRGTNATSNSSPAAICPLPIRVLTRSAWRSRAPGGWRGELRRPIAAAICLLLVDVEHVGLVACVKGKLGRRVAARDLYTSALFRLSRAYVERRCSQWAILSAKHGLVLPSDEIDPYDETLIGMPRRALEDWSRRTWAAISLRWDPATTTFVFLGGQAYSFALGAAPHVERPLGRLQIGERLAFLKRATEGAR